MTLRTLVPLALCLAVPFALLYGLGRISRWYANRHDPIDTLIKEPRWRKDGDAYMDTMDWSKSDRAGERVWCETLRAQRRTRRPAQVTESSNVVAIGIKRRNG